MNTPLSRRDLFAHVGRGLHGAALAWLLTETTGLKDAQAFQGDLNGRNTTQRTPPFAPRAKAVIHLFMNGGPSQVDLFDPKPALKRHAGSRPTQDIASEIEFTNEAGGLLPSPFTFHRHGQCGMELSELLPHLAGCADDLCLIRSMYGEHFNHEPSLYLMHTGRTIPGRPALGSWVVYALGSENENLPSYVVLDDPKGLPINGIQNWSSGWMPSIFQGTRIRSQGPPLLNLNPAEELPSGLVEVQRSLQRRLDERHRTQRPGQAELDARIASFELAARMQLAAPEALDLSQESAATRQLYGIDQDATASYGKRCLMARRLVERGVRFVQIYIEGQIWDTHSGLESGLRYACQKTDKPIAALLTDLKRRGLLESTLVMWGGEFGRLPIAQIRGDGNQAAGRDHGPSGFSVWLAGGGVKGGYVHGATDELGHKAVEHRTSVHDLHATLLHLLGFDHRKLVYPRLGLNERLTDQFPAGAVSEVVA